MMGINSMWYFSNRYMTAIHITRWNRLRIAENELAFNKQAELLCVLLLCIAGLRSVMPLINEDWFIEKETELMTWRRGWIWFDVGLSYSWKKPHNRKHAKTRGFATTSKFPSPASEISQILWNFTNPYDSGQMGPLCSGSNVIARKGTPFCQLQFVAQSLRYLRLLQ